MIVLVILVPLVVWLVARRIAKRRLVAGLVASRPMFTTTPPVRRIGKRETL